MDPYPPIERLAAELRDLRRELAVVAALPDLVPQRDEQLRDVSRRLDERLVLAAEMLEVDAPERVPLAPTERVTLLRDLAGAGLDVEPPPARPDP
ncbi:MAG: hypothetical protein IPM45_03050 [Acidimicrobiales bacterium]|nr:hypothetical protein [Acidimicrobiales bacterium]